MNLGSLAAACGIFGDIGMECTRMLFSTSTSKTCSFGNGEWDD
jgi:hypothetical protein